MHHRLLSAIALLSLHAVAQSAQAMEVSARSVSCFGGAYGARLPGKLSELRQLGEVRVEQPVRVEEWDGYKAIEKRLQFDGLSVNIITFSNDPERYSLASLSVQSSRWSVSPFRVGEPPVSLFELLGVKLVSTGAWRFQGESDSLYVEVREGKVVRIAYECYTG
jgi:hypothetical protein